MFRNSVPAVITRVVVQLAVLVLLMALFNRVTGLGVPVDALAGFAVVAFLLGGATACAVAALALLGGVVEGVLGDLFGIDDQVRR
jgi:hypothetical protein